MSKPLKLNWSASSDAVQNVGPKVNNATISQIMVILSPSPYATQNTSIFMLYVFLLQIDI
jgi:hypothetical protein